MDGWMDEEMERGKVRLRERVRGVLEEEREG